MEEISRVKGVVCSTHGGGGDEKYVQNWSESLRGRDHSENVGIDGKIIQGNSKRR
jgi:hypothetical protein